MLIRTLTRAAGRLSWQPGQQMDLPAEEARELVRTGQAVAVELPVMDRGADAAPLAEPTPAEPAPAAVTVPKKPPGKKRK